MGDRAEEDLRVCLAELEELLAERDIELARAMRGAERDRLRHSYERAEERLRAQVARLAAAVIVPTDGCRTQPRGSD